jgi:hypothetical protein
MTEDPAAWIATGMIVRQDGGTVSLADIENVWDAMNTHLATLGLRVAGTRALPLSQHDMESADPFAALRAAYTSGEQPL